jgi:hypothetical protein
MSENYVLFRRFTAINCWSRMFLSHEPKHSAEERNRPKERCVVWKINVNLTRTVWYVADFGTGTKFRIGVRVC